MTWSLAIDVYVLHMSNMSLLPLPDLLWLSNLADLSHLSDLSYLPNLPLLHTIHLSLGILSTHAHSRNIPYHAHRALIHNRFALVARAVTEIVEAAPVKRAIVYETKARERFWGLCAKPGFADHPEWCALGWKRVPDFGSPLASFAAGPAPAKCPITAIVFLFV